MQERPMQEGLRGLLERRSGISSSSAMSIETLNTAVHAAGFAMATSDESADDTRPDKLPQGEAWRPGEAVLLSPDEVTAKAAPSIAARLKAVPGLLARGAPA